jgi:hypothetical protein
MDGVMEDITDGNTENLQAKCGMLGEMMETIINV